MKYTSVKLPTQLRHRIDLIKNEKGYKSVTEFVLEATRISLMQQEKSK